MKRIVLALILISSTSHGYEYGRALNNQAHEMATCAAYFMLVSKVLSNVNDDETSKSYLESSGYALKLSIEMSDKELTEARLEMSLEEMSAKIGGKGERISILFPDYAVQCKDMLNNPYKRLEYWINKK